MSTGNFFESIREQSVTKASIVIDYYLAWSRILLPRAKKKLQNIAYVDLFAGPGVYEDGSPSTPIQLVQKTLSRKELHEHIILIFNDANVEYCNSLKNCIQSVRGIAQLKHFPQIHNIEIGEDIAKLFEKIRLIPTLLFIDPFGYKGLSLRLINSVLKNWGCECIFFFNFNRINMAINNPIVESNIQAIFGEKRAHKMRSTIKNLSPVSREEYLVKELSDALKQMGERHVQQFGFKTNTGTRTSHYLVHVTKNMVGHNIMKEIMAKSSTESQQGVASFDFNPKLTSNLLLPFDLSMPLDKLGEMILQEFAGKTMTMKQIFELHNIGKPFIKRNYKDILLQLEKSGNILVDPPRDLRPKINNKATFSDDTRVTFLESGHNEH